MLRDPPRPGAENMAADHALAVSTGRDASVDGGPGRAPATLRLYTWSRPTASFGRNEPTNGVYDRARAAELDVDLVRRPTGGRAVLHAEELTYAVVIPARVAGAVRGRSGARATYRLVNEALVDAVRTLGAQAELSGRREQRTPSLDAGPCFQSPSEGEVVAGGRKLIGSAQARIGGAFLQHGSIIVSGDQSLLSELGPSTDHEQPATLAAQIGAVGIDRIADAVVTSMKKVFGGTWVEGRYSDTERQTITTLVRERYATDEWTWRR